MKDRFVLLVAITALAACEARETEVAEVAEEPTEEAAMETATDPVESAVRAAPASLSAGARVVDWSGNELRAGTNEWTCLPDRPDTPGDDPWCVNEPWLRFLEAYVERSTPEYDRVGIAYMLMGDTPVSNTDPYATEPTSDEDWVEDLGAHLMILVPDVETLSDVSSDPENGGPWVMWPDTPYAHLMIPIEGAPR